MPSPLAHLAAGYAFYHLFKSHEPVVDQGSRAPSWPLLALTMTCSMLPDIDVIPAVLFGDFQAVHNHLTHSLVTGLLVALAIAAAWFRGRGFARWFGIVGICYAAHIVMDSFTGGRGVMLFWPFTGQRYSAPLQLFRGVHWTEGLLSFEHLVTVASELSFAVAVVWGALVFSRLRRRQLALSSLLGERLDDGVESGEPLLDR